MVIPGIRKIKNHPFFKGINWHALENLKVPSPFKPDQNKINFDVKHELEEMLQPNAVHKLKYRPRSHHSNRTRTNSIRAQMNAGVDLIELNDQRQNDVGDAEDKIVEGGEYWNNLPPDMKRLELEFMDYNFERANIPPIKQSSSSDSLISSDLLDYSSPMSTSITEGE